MNLFERQLRRRDFLKACAALAAAGMLPGGLVDARRALASATALRTPGSLPFPGRPASQPQPDLAPELANIDHIIIVMMENHSFDNYFGMLPWQVPALAGRVDGYPQLTASGTPAVTQVDPNGVVQHSYHMPGGCQPSDVSQSWDSSHLSYDGGKLDGFLRESSVQALGYWDGGDLPFYYALASSFPVCDRWFCSTLCQTYPNRVFMMAGTAAGLVSTDTPPPTVTPRNGHIFEVLDHYGIGWADYYSELPSPGLFGAAWAAQQEGTHLFGPFGAPQATIQAFAALCQANQLPPVIMVEGDYQWGSEENPQDIQVGQTFVAGVVDALCGSPAWERSLLVFTYDEHGGYYDHVVPPAALQPGDGSHPQVAPGDTFGDDYTLYGFRVPTVIVSPWAKRGYTSHTVFDHTSILATIQRKWNLPALTYRDANANHIGDALVSSGPAPFAQPPALPAVPQRTEADSISCEYAGGSDVVPPVGVPESPAGAWALAGAAAAAAGVAGRRMRSRGRTPVLSEGG